MRMMQWMSKCWLRLLGNIKVLALTVSSATLLVSCSGDDMADLKSYVASVKARPAGRIPPLPAFEAYVMVPYAAANLRDPFLPFMKVTDATTPSQPQDKSKPVTTAPNPMRAHKPEPLEKFPLDGLKFVGLLERQGERWAIITAPDKLVHRVKIGNYLGESYGRIVSITETKIDLIETIPDGLGGWVERPATLSVVE